MLVNDRLHRHPAFLAELEMVGFRSAGKVFSRFARFFWAMFIFSPTLVSASSAPLSKSASVSIFCRFHASFHAV